MESSAHLIPLVDDLTYILLKAGKNKTALIEGRNDAEHCRGSLGGTHILRASLLTRTQLSCVPRTPQCGTGSRSRGTKNSSGCKEALNLLAPETPRQGSLLVNLVKIDSGTVFVDDGIHEGSGDVTIIFGKDNLK